MAIVEILLRRDSVAHLTHHCCIYNVRPSPIFLYDLAYFIGSVYWMAPEVVKQTSYTRKADIWSLGCLVVEMFTGSHPFPDFSQMQAIFKVHHFKLKTDK